MRRQDHCDLMMLFAARCQINIPPPNWQERDVARVFRVEIECWLLHPLCGVLGGKAAAQVQWEGGVGGVT